jgi:NAD(P)H dehydrogenase (quinone)
MVKNIVIVNGHPRENSLSKSFADAYQKGAEKTGAKVTRFNIKDMDLDVYFDGYKSDFVETDSAREFKEALKEANHLVLCYPTWWGTMPGRLKILIETTFAPGFAFRYHKNDPFWDKLLAGKSARVIVTMGAPVMAYHLMMGASGHKQVKKNILKFTGFKPVKITSFGQAEKASEKKINSWLDKVRRLGEKQV